MIRKMVVGQPGSSTPTIPSPSEKVPRPPHANRTMRFSARFATCGDAVLSAPRLREAGDSDARVTGCSRFRSSPVGPSASGHRIVLSALQHQWNLHHAGRIREIRDVRSRILFGNPVVRREGFEPPTLSSED